MRWWSRPQVRRTRTPKSLKEICADAFKKELDKDPVLLKKVAFKEMGYQDLVQDTNPAEQAKQKIRDNIYNRVSQRIEENPELAEQYDERVLDDVIGRPTQRRFGHDSEEYGGYSNPLTEALVMIEGLETLKDKLGGKSGALGGLINADIMKGVAEVLRAIKGEGRGQLQRTYIVQVNGESREVDETQYQALIAQNRLKPIAALAESPEKPIVPKPEEFEQPFVPTTPEEEVPIISEEPELPDFIKDMDFDEIIGYLEMPPEQFVDILKTTEEPSVQLLQSLLMTTTYEQIATYLEPYRTHSTVGYYVQVILSDEHKEWIETVLSLLKENESSE